jgi:hypothetical protein
VDAVVFDWQRLGPARAPEAVAILTARPTRAHHVVALLSVDELMETNGGHAKDRRSQSTCTIFGRPPSNMAATRSSWRSRIPNTT